MVVDFQDALLGRQVRAQERYDTSPGDRKMGMDGPSPIPRWRRRVYYCGLPTPLGPLWSPSRATFLQTLGRS